MGDLPLILVTALSGIAALAVVISAILVQAGIWDDDPWSGLKLRPWMAVAAVLLALGSFAVSQPGRQTAFAADPTPAATGTATSTPNPNSTPAASPTKTPTAKATSTATPAGPTTTLLIQTTKGLSKSQQDSLI